MHELEVPLPLTGLEIDRDETFSEQVVAGPVSAVVVRRRRFHGQIHEAEVLVHAGLRPDADVAVDCPRVVLPRFGAELPGSRDRVERPEELPGARI
jgi:hypothetical protein